MLLDRSSSERDNAGMLLVIRAEEGKRPIPVLKEHFSGQGHLETGAGFYCDQQGANPVAIAIDACAQFTKIERSFSGHSEQLLVLLLTKNCKTPVFGHPEPCATLSPEGVLFSIAPARKLHSLSVNVWLHIRAFINRPVHLVPTFLRLNWARIVCAACVPRKQNVLQMFSRTCDSKLHLFGNKLFQPRKSEVSLKCNGFNRNRFCDSVITGLLTRIGDVRALIKSKRVYTSLPTGVF